MLATVLTETVLNGDETLDDAAAVIWAHPQVLAELSQLLEVISDRIEHVHQPLSTHPDVPLNVHARYTRRGALAAFAPGNKLKVPEWREGTRWVADMKVELLALPHEKNIGNR